MSKTRGGLHTTKKVQQINVLGKTYQVVYRKLAPSKLTQKGRIPFGRTNSMTQTVLINSELCEEQRFDTLLHEVLHIMDEDMSLRLGERNVTRLGSGLAGFLIQHCDKLFRSKEKKH